jgi:hypothetical protein
MRFSLFGKMVCRMQGAAFVGGFGVVQPYSAAFGKPFAEYLFGKPICRIPHKYS